MSTKALIKKCLKPFVKKEALDTDTFLTLFGFLRIPYKTHTEHSDLYTRRYIRMLGLEICYKKLPLQKPPLNEDYTFEPMPPVISFAMEDRVTPEIRQRYCEYKGYKKLGYFPDLRNPRSLNEKIIWLALNYKNPDIVIAANKSTAREWLQTRIDSKHLVPIYGIYYDVNDIDFNALPNRFVAKYNSGWGGNHVLVVRDKTVLDVDYVKATLSSWLFPWNAYYYQNMCVTDAKMEKPAIVIEQYLEQSADGELSDYKFYCCNGEPKFALMVAGRGTDHQSRSFVDMDWKVLPFARAGMAVNGEVQPPASLATMIDLCRKLSKGFPFVRVDFYEVDGHVYVGEMTFTPGMFLPFTSKEWDFKLGEYLTLPQANDQ